MVTPQGMMLMEKMDVSSKVTTISKSRNRSHHAIGGHAARRAKQARPRAARRRALEPDFVKR